MRFNLAPVESEREHVRNPNQVASNVLEPCLSTCSQRHRWSNWKKHVSFQMIKQSFWVFCRPVSSKKHTELHKPAEPP